MLKELSIELSLTFTEALRMLAETLKVAILASSQRLVQITEGTTIISNKSNQRSSSGINAWIPRWNTPAQPMVAQEATSSESSGRSNFVLNFL